MVAHAFNNRHGARVADGKALAGNAVQEDFATRCAIQHHVPHQDAFFGQEARGLRRIRDDASAGKSLAQGNRCSRLRVRALRRWEQMRRSSGRPTRQNLKWMVSSGNPADPYRRAISPPSIAPTVRWTLRIAKLPVTGVFDSSAGLALRDQCMIERLVQAMILRLHACGAPRARARWASTESMRGRCPSPSSAHRQWLRRSCPRGPPSRPRCGSRAWPYAAASARR